MHKFWLFYIITLATLLLTCGVLFIFGAQGCSPCILAGMIEFMILILSGIIGSVYWANQEDV